VWLEHTVITEFLDHATSVLIRLNSLLLMVVSFLPFPIALGLFLPLLAVLGYLAHRGVHHRSLRCAPAPGRRGVTERRAGPPATTS
jgi:hypothetical protein